MLENFITVARQVAILFALMSVGYIAARRCLLTAEAVRGCVTLLITIVTPAIIIHSFERPFRADAMRSLMMGIGIVAVSHALGYFLPRYLIRAPRPKTTRVLRFAAMFSNAGFMGLPLEYALLGEEGVFYGAIYVIGFNVVCWTLGLTVIAPRGKMGGGINLRQILLNPGTVGIYLGLPLFLFSLRLPPVIHETVSYLSDLNTPLAMVVIGFYLYGAKFAAAIRTRAAVITILLRLVVIPLLVLALLMLLPQANPVMAIAMVTAASAPVAAMTSMLSARYDQDTEMAAAIVAATTLLSIFSMPLIIAFAYQVFQ